MDPRPSGVRPEMVGRDRELAVLLDQLASALAGRPQLVLCTGEAGIGKTRLAQELTALAATQACLCAWGHALEVSGAPPYWPWSEVLGALAETVDVAGLARERSLDAELAGVAPQLFSNPVPDPRSGGPAGDRFRQFDAVARILRELCRRRPLVVVLEDVHWADPSTMLLLRHVARSLTDERLLILATARPAESGDGTTLAGLRREPLTTVVELRGLSEPAIGSKLRRIVGGDVEDAVVEEVRALTAGNPLFVGEVGRAIADARAGHRFTPLTATLREAIADRLARLPQACIRFLQAAAVVGREFAAPLVATMVDADAVQGLELAAEAVGAGLLEPQRGPAGFRFVHALVGDAIEAALAPADAVLLHRRAAEAIEGQHGHALGQHVFDVARHRAACAAAGDGALLGARWSARAGEEAMRQLAYEEAARLFLQAVELAGGAIGPAQRCTLLVLAGRALHLAGDLGARLEVCLDAAALAREIGRPDLMAEAALVMEAVGNPGFDLAARRLCEEAFAALDPQQLALRARVRARFVETFVFLRHPGEIAAASVEALELAEQSGDARALADALRARQVVCVRPEGLAERMGLAGRMLDLGRRTGDPQAEMWGHLWSIDAALERGDLATMSQTVEALALSADRVRGPFARFEVARCRAILAYAQARLADARRLEAVAFTALAPTGHDTRFTFRSAMALNIGHHAGYDEAAIAGLQYSGAAPEHDAMLGFIGNVALASAFLDAGLADQAAARYRALGPVARWDPPPHVILCGYVFGLCVAAALGESGDVAALHDLLSAYRGHHVASGMSAMTYYGPVELWLGLADQHLGRLDDAVSNYASAEVACAANGAAGFLVESRLRLASARLARRRGDDIEVARVLAAGAASTAGALGMHRIAAEARGLLGRLEATGPLTRREGEVADLVAQGLTNRQIAERLFISERTAENHVQHILVKLGVPNRSALAVWAATAAGTPK